MLIKVENYRKNEIPKEKLLESYQGWKAYAKWADTYKLRNKLFNMIEK